MLYIVYREDENGVRYLVESGLTEEAAQKEINKRSAGWAHKQEYEMMAYHQGELRFILSEYNINQ
jgi:hypothetical protein